MKKSIDDINVRGKRVLVRLDLNVPLDERRAITDDRRIRETLAEWSILFERKGWGRDVCPGSS
jgi:3-phosphoglycerate kinase